jgi:probable HAF family extracellular repeat protein
MRKLAILACCPSVALAQATFTGLGHLGSTVSYSEGYGVSGDGSTAVGMSLLSGGIGGLSAAFGWSGGTIMPVYNALGGSAYAYGASADGSVIVGYADFGAFSPLGVQPFVYTVAGGGVLLGDFQSNTGVPRAFGRAVSADGTTIAGTGTSSHGTEAFVLNLVVNQFVGLGALSQANFSSWAYGVSGDGSVVVGASYSAAQELQAFRWTAAGGIQGLGFLASPANLARWGQAEAISADGSVIVGECRSNNSQNGMEAFRWTQAGGMVGLGDLAGGAFQSWAYAANNDGSVIVGRATIDGVSGPFGGGSAPRAFIWDAVNGMRDLEQVLQNAGAPITGWNLQEARSVSADGRTIVGTGIGPDGTTQAWIATVPAAVCYANCDNSTQAPILNIDDFQCFLNKFAAADPWANCDGSTVPPVLNVNDFQCFLNAFAAGCP